MKIVPAILEKNLKDAQLKLNLAASFASTIQVDISDGVFVPTQTGDIKELKKLSCLKSLEWHLMVQNPAKYFAVAQKLKIKTVIIHFESVENWPKMLKTLQKYHFQAGLAINPETTLPQVSSVIDAFKFVLLLAVNPGAQGQKFIPNVWRKIQIFKKKDPKKFLAVDGGINFKNIMRLKKLGVDEVVIGSAIFFGDPKNNFKKLRDKIIQ